VVAVGLFAAIGARVAPAPHSQVPYSASRACGVERWSVKTLQDRAQLLPRRETTVGYLGGRVHSRPLALKRLALERQVFRVTAAVTLVRREADGDLHLVLRDGANQMIAEAPSSACTRKATAYRRRQMAAARSSVRVCARAQMTGVAFFDFAHGQTGGAPNAIELHPILTFRCLDSGPSPPPPPAPPPPPPAGGNCALSYPTVCITPPPPDLNCADIAFINFTVLWTVAAPDPHRFDGDRDGIGCET
jgi:hypothetical protein